MVEGLKDDGAVRGLMAGGAKVAFSRAAFLSMDRESVSGSSVRHALSHCQSSPIPGGWDCEGPDLLVEQTLGMRVKREDYSETEVLLLVKDLNVLRAA